MNKYANAEKGSRHKQYVKQFYLKISSFSKCILLNSLSMQSLSVSESAYKTEERCDPQQT